MNYRRICWPVDPIQVPVPDSACTYSESQRPNNNDNEEMNICRRNRDLPITSSDAGSGKLGKRPSHQRRSRTQDLKPSEFLANSCFNTICSNITRVVILTWSFFN